MTTQRLVANKQELADSCLRFFLLTKSVNSDDQAYFKSKAKNIKRFVALAVGNSYIFAPGAYVAYHGCSTVDEWKQIGIEGGRTPGRKYLDRLMADSLITEGHPAYERLMLVYNDFCDEKDVTPSKHPRPVTFWLLSEEGNGKEDTYPDDIPDSKQYPEGTARTVTVNAYERNQEARLACIAHYKHRYSCEICGFNFMEAYGEWGKDYIQVHHLVPLSEIREKYTVSPKTDLIPVCCNCHAMIHRRKGSALSPKELKGILKLKKS